MSDKRLPLREQFCAPTVRQCHATGDWDTAIGRRNYHVTAERILCAKLAFGGTYDGIISESLDLTDDFYDALEDRRQ